MDLPPETAPAPATTPAEKLHTAKFSDLNAYFQGLQTRLAVTLALVALSITAAGSVGGSLPKLPSGAPLLLLGAAALTYGLVIWHAGDALFTPRRINTRIEDRLAARDLQSADAIDDHLQTLLVKEIKRRHDLLANLQSWAWFGTVCLISHALVAVTGTMQDFATVAVHPKVCDALSQSAEICGVTSLSTLYLVTAAGFMAWREWVRRSN